MAKKTKEMKKEKNKKKVVEVQNSYSYSMFTIFKIVFGVLVFLAIFYLITVAVIDDGSASKDEKEEVDIQYDEILAGSSFSMNSSEYLVVYYDFTDEELTDLDSAIYSYSSSDETRIYTVDMSNAFNLKFVAEKESNKSPKSVNDLAFDGPTLIKFKDGKVTKYIEDSEEIIKYLD